MSISSMSGVVYIGSHSHLFSAVDLMSGRTLWQTVLNDRVESSACLSACQRYIIVGKCLSLSHSVYTNLDQSIWAGGR